MIGDVDSALRRLLVAETYPGETITVALDPPTKDWAARRSGPVLNMFLNDVRENTQRRRANYQEVKNDEGKYEYVYDTKKGRATVPNRIYGGKVVENICQALARIAIGEQMLLVAKHYKVVMTVHDAIACIVPEHEVETGLEYVEMCMRMRPKWALELPLNCEAGSGVSYGDC